MEYPLNFLDIVYKRHIYRNIFTKQQFTKFNLLNKYIEE